MSLPKVVSRAEWLTARKDLLAQEKELTRRRDALSAERRRLPMVEIDKPYVFTGPDGETSLLELFDGRLQLILDALHVRPRVGERLPELHGRHRRDVGRADGARRGPRHHDGVGLAGADREAGGYRARRGWTIPWYSSYGATSTTTSASRTARRAPSTYNYRADEHEATGTATLEGEYPGTSVFLRVEDRVFHTYSSFARGAEWTGGSYAFLDLTALGRQEDWEEPKGRSESVRIATPDFAS